MCSIHYLVRVNSNFFLFFYIYQAIYSIEKYLTFSLLQIENSMCKIAFFDYYFLFLTKNEKSRNIFQLKLLGELRSTEYQGWLGLEAGVRVSFMFAKEDQNNGSFGFLVLQWFSVLCNFFRYSADYSGQRGCKLV